MTELSADKVHVSLTGDWECDLWLSQQCDWEDISHAVMTATNSFQTPHFEMHLIHAPSEEVVGRNIDSASEFWKLYKEVYACDQEIYKFIIHKVKRCAMRCYLSFDLFCNEGVEVPINSSWETIIDTIAAKFSNVAPSCVDSLVVMTGQEREDDLSDPSLLLTDAPSFWCTYAQFLSDCSNKSEAVVNVKVNTCPAYSIPLTLADDTYFKAVIKVPVHETSWDAVTNAIYSALQLNGISLEIDYIALVDMDGDTIGPVITDAPSLCRRFSKSFDSSDETMKFLIFCKSRILQPEVNDHETVSCPVVTTDQMTLRGNIRVHGVCEDDLSKAAVFHVNAGFSWHDILQAFCTPLAICSCHLISHLQIWNASGHCIGPPLTDKKTFFDECQKNYSFDEGMFIAAVCKDSDEF